MTELEAALQALAAVQDMQAIVIIEVDSPLPFLAVRAIAAAPAPPH